MRTIRVLLFLLICPFLLRAQEHNMSANYIAPSDPGVQANLKKWQKLKFGLFMHWGTYSQWGVVESWSICPEDEGWTQRKGPYGATYNGYKAAYENLQTTFNPTKFAPEKWVKAAKAAGMKYVVFTTKHHDGFSMFDTKQTDYKITSSKTPFSSNPRANVTKEIFNAFSKENFMIGAYFSKPDWHSEDYWWPYFPPKDRNVNYDPAKHPDHWQKFKDFTYNQISELMSDYGKVDILWLDGGWVRPKNTIDTTVDWQKAITFNQDIDMPRIAKMARSKQPGLIVVDRTVAGEYENYTTPEQTVPNQPLSHPWESCITMGNSWSYVPGDKYKSANEIVNLLVKIVSRGGNLLMNIGPGPDGDWDPTAYNRLADIGKWMAINQEGIYNSIPVAPYSENNVYYTQSENGKSVYAFVTSATENVTIPDTLTLHLQNAKQVKSVKLLGVAGKIKFSKQSDAITLNIPVKLQNTNGLKQAAVFKIQY
ncbi:MULTISPECIES: alpha-L-fucosidase [unclassified Mucilaginibacter]|uniref:alpha-L-fucosidase n=1 Tax=unclassified Mucilaginibacter TaxID=2617802 RepID=UPI00095E426E|nr:MULTISPECIES: alpha-L-fucosidase [unclassified Mucilaginibacter]OJW18163.1 MAG: alpha-L-fucosidase [Mucilaginibacter sp. 44-25]PLW89728.1 MAG: alpha-L-fucosidase [Mucilaginibacter sp.]PMP66003.1 MAG: alpha-L-fucosidase [Mucilaginibacter sp.]HEK22342.1 alpha-L-fucosidase [Bacteroidota bacterium]